MCIIVTPSKIARGRHAESSNHLYTSGRKPKAVLKEASISKWFIAAFLTRLLESQ